MAVQKCRFCQKTKSIDDYYRYRGKADSVCKACRKVNIAKTNRKRYEKNRAAKPIRYLPTLDEISKVKGEIRKENLDSMRKSSDKELSAYA